MPTDREAIEEFQKWASHVLTTKSGMYNVVVKREVEMLTERMGLRLTDGAPAQMPRLVRAELLAAE